MLLAKFRRVLVAIGGLLLVACTTVGNGTSAIPHQMVRERETLPAVFKAEDGSSYAADIDAVVFRPDDNRVHPLVVINHGYSNKPESLFADQMPKSAVEFARRGWVAVIFSRRGYGLSEGKVQESIIGCSTSEFIRAGRRSAEDIHEVIRLMKKKTYVDGSKVISVGVTAGGYASIASTIDPPPGLIAVISFSAGFHTSKADFKTCFKQSQIEAAGWIGGHSRTPVLWIHPKNDRQISIDTGRGMFEEFTKAGGIAEFVDMAAFSNADDTLFRDGVSLWVPYVDAFLQKQEIRQMDELIPAENIRKAYKQ